MVTSELCEWCNGTGTDSETMIYKGCPDCQGTGYRYGEHGRLKYLEGMNKLDEELDWNIVDKYLNKRY